MKITPKRYQQGFAAAVVVLAITRCAFPNIAGNKDDRIMAASDTLKTDIPVLHDYAKDKSEQAFSEATPMPSSSGQTCFFNPDGTLRKNRIYSVSSFKGVFPDSNNVQLAAAARYGVSPVKDRKEAELRMNELVYVGSNPYFHVDKLNSSIPYLVPRAAVLLQDIGRAYFDSLQIKGIPLHKIIVTSVLRTRDDVQKLRNRNGNATENSCHLYGTTFDICYNRYKTVEDPDGQERRRVRNDTLKWVLSEVLRDFREQGRCYIKYEVKQGCFHMTVN
ncbi:MAG: hypothetical protein K2L56_02115 [Prevotella sp.]|nr:hypothetical protein [Prevotella sp.]